MVAGTNTVLGSWSRSVLAFVTVLFEFRHDIGASVFCVQSDMIEY